MAIKHTKVSAKPDGGDASLVQASDWNADHAIDSDVDVANHKLTNVATPTNAADAATKDYVDTLFSVATKDAAFMRPLGVPFRPSLRHHTFLTYTAGLTINASPDDAGMFLMSDAGPDVQTVRCKATLFNPAIGANAVYAGCRSNLSYICPPGHYVKLQQSNAGPSAQSSILHVIEQELKFGNAPVVVNQDGPDDWYLPESNEQFVALGLDEPDALWLMQDPSGNPVDEHGWCRLTAGGTVSRGNAEAGWDRLFLGTTNGVAGSFLTSSSTLPNGASGSLGVFMVVKVSAPTATRSLLEFFANDLRARVTATPRLQIFVDGGATQDGTADPTGMRAIYMQYDFTNQTATIFTDQEVITTPWVVGASRAVIFGSQAAAATARYGYAFALYGAKAEKSQAQAKTMFNKLNIAVPW